MNRPFYSSGVRSAGGVSFEHIAGRKTYTLDDDFKYYTRRYVMDTWYGRSFFLGTSGQRFLFRNNLTLSGRANWVNVVKRDEVLAPYFTGMQSKLRLLASLSWTRQAYFKSHLIYNFGRTEDIPVGARLDLTAGTEIHEDHRRAYLGAGAGVAKLTGKQDYFSLQADLGGFFDGRDVNQAVLNLSANTFTRLFPIGSRYALRNFIKLTYVGGQNMYMDEYLSLQDIHERVNSFRSDSVYGNQRLTLDLETACFTPWKFMGFRMVLFAFADMNLIGDRTTPMFKSSLYSSLGVGLRMRNEMLVFNTLQIRLSFFPKIPAGTEVEHFRILGEPYFRPRDFSPRSPSSVPYK